MPRGVKKENLPSKICVTCERPFTWRKKWEKCWDEVTTCSKSCNAKRRKEKQRKKHEEADSGDDDENQDNHQNSAMRSKVCSLCETDVQEAFRVRYDESRLWKFVCKGCWPQASGRSSSKEVGEGTPNPLYQYGGTWKAVIGSHKISQ